LEKSPMKRRSFFELLVLNSRQSLFFLALCIYYSFLSGTRMLCSNS
jgi:hypothetical protein